MANINFLVQSKKTDAIIYVRFRIGRAIDIKVRTELIIKTATWSKTKESPKSLNDADSKSINAGLTKIKSDILREYNKIDDATTINSDWLKRIVKANYQTKNEQNKDELIVFTKNYIDDKEGENVIESTRKYKTYKNYISVFQTHTKKTFKIRDVNLEFIKGFEALMKENKYGVNTIGKAVGFIKSVCEYGGIKGHKVHPELPLIKGKKEVVKFIYLDKEEIQKINETEYKRVALDNARDWLIISCECGQRISDFLNFTKKTVIERLHDNEMTKFLFFTQQKTKTVLELPISPIIIKILEKRNGEFPYKISHDKYNEYIKDVCKIAGITNIVQGRKKVLKRNVEGKYPKYELVSSHIGRRSFASNRYGVMYNSIIMSYTGHKTESSFLTYVGKPNNQTALEMIKYYKNE
jgi:hypothetical protein